MNRKTLNLLLGVVAIGLVGLAAYKQRVDDVKRTPAKGAPLTALAKPAIEHIALRHPGAAEIRLERKDGRWQLTAPVAALADGIEVDKLLSLASAETRDTLDLATIKRQDFGLDPAGYTLTLNDTVLAFGDIEQIKYLRYVEVDPGKPDDKLALIADPDAGVLDSDYTDLVSKTLLPAAPAISGIELPGLKVEHTASGWTTQPADQNATQDALQSFVDAWTHASAVRTEAPSAPPGESKHLLATISFADGSRRSFGIADRDPQLILDDAALKVRYRFAPDLSKQLLALPKPPPKTKLETKPEAKPEAKSAADKNAADKDAEPAAPK